MSAAARPPSDSWVQLPPRELVAVVHLHPAPDIPLASIRHLLRPLHDEHGALVDWYLFGSGFEDHDAVVSFRRWRATWRREWPIGSLAHATWLRRELVDLEHVLDDQALAGLIDLVIDADGDRAVRVAPSATGRLRTELATVRLALSADDRHGWAIVDDMPAAAATHGLVRTWTAPDGDSLIAGTPRVAIVVRRSGALAIVHAGSPPFEGVTAADLRGDTVVVLNERGSSLRLSQEDARPLGWLVPRSLRWHVREIPLLSVWSSFVVGLGEALDLSAATGEPVVITGETGVA